jgi:1,2-diacylglycerol-3-alpha-glucose alpha-1,2-glucosyltransferase
MSVINFIIDEKTVNRLTKNKAWLETYIPELTKRLESRGFIVVFDREFDFDLVHIHMPLRLAYRLIKSHNRHRDYPVIYHGHATEDSFWIGRGTKYSLRKWFKKIAGQSDLIICPSRSAEKYYRSLLPDHDIIQLNYGINLDKYSYSDESRMKFREKYDIGKDEVVVCCVGGISKRKGIVEFINISRQHPELRFMWVGGEYTHHPAVDLFYKVFARRGDVKFKNLPENILFTGYTSEIPAALSASDIFFFPSKQETQGLALVEAAANSRPIITRDIPVFREWLTPGHDCLMGNTEDEFNMCIKHIIDDHALSRQLGIEARKSVEKYHDIDKTSARLAQIYHELLA